MHAESFQLCLTLGNSVDRSPRGSSIHGASRKNPGVGCQEIFLTQGLNPRLLYLLHCVCVCIYKCIYTKDGENAFY